MDAVVLSAANGTGQALTWIALVDFYRFAAMLTRPLLVEVPASITGPEIEQVWRVGAAGIVVRVTASELGRLQDLRAAIAAMAPPVPPRGNRPVARVPATPMPSVPEEEEEEEDE